MKADKKNIGKKIQIEKCRQPIVGDGLRFVGLVSGENSSLSIALMDKDGVRRAVVWGKNKTTSIVPSFERIESLIK